MKLPNPKAVRLGVTFIGLAAVVTVLQGQIPNAPGPLHNRIPLAEDWSHRHLIYSSPSTFGQAL